MFEFGIGRMFCYNADGTSVEFGTMQSAGIKFNFSKKELRRAMESASYASGTYPRIEKKGGESSLLVFALNLGKVLAGKHKDEEGNPAPLDPAFFDNCLANRDKHAGFAIDDEDGELDLDDILADADEQAGEEGETATDDE